MYATYFEQSDAKFDMACELLRVQFPVDPAYKAKAKDEESKQQEPVVTPAGEPRLGQSQAEEVGAKYSSAPQGVPVVLETESKGDEAQAEGLESGLAEQDKVEGPPADDENAVYKVSVLQKDESVCIDLTGEIAREIFMHLRIRLEKNGQQNKFDQTLQVLHQILQNLLKDPLDTKYHKLKLQNKKISEFISTQIECVNLLELLGFAQRQDMISEDGQLLTMLFIEQAAVLENFIRIQQVGEICSELLSEKSVNSLIKHFEEKRAAAGGQPTLANNVTSLSQSQKRIQIQKMANQQANIKNKLLEAQFSRQQRMANDPQLIAQQRALAYQNERLDTYLGQLQHYRKM